MFKYITQVLLPIMYNMGKLERGFCGMHNWFALEVRAKVKQKQQHYPFGKEGDSFLCSRVFLQFF